MMDGVKTSAYNGCIVKVVQKAPSKKGKEMEFVVQTRSAKLLPRVKVPNSLLVPTRPLQQIIKYTNVDLMITWDDITKEIINGSSDFTSPEHAKVALAQGFFVGLDKQGPKQDGSSESKVLSNWTDRMRFIPHTEWAKVESDFVGEQKMGMQKIPVQQLPYNRTFDWCGFNFNDDDNPVWIEYYAFTDDRGSDDPCQSLLSKILTDQAIKGASYLFAKLSIAPSVC